jgi:hypothetical protein
MVRPYLLGDILAGDVLGFVGERDRPEEDELL